MALPLQTVTIAEALKDSGYTTGYIGKWHLGNSRSTQPDHQGYDFSAVINGPHLPGRFRVQNNADLKPQSASTGLTTKPIFRLISSSKTGRSHSF